MFKIDVKSPYHIDVIYECDNFIPRYMIDVRRNSCTCLGAIMFNARRSNKKCKHIAELHEKLGI